MIKSPNIILRLLKRKDIGIVIENMSEDYKGYVYHENRVIHIDSKQKIKERVSTLIHECLHLLNPKHEGMTTTEQEHVILGVEKEVLAKLSKRCYNELSKYVV